MVIDATSAEQCLLTKEGRNNVTEKTKNLQLEQYGFGPNVMKKTKVCLVCGATADANESECFRCGADLPGETLFDLYKSWHQYCDHCGTVVSNTSAYCPECGTQLKRRQPRFLRREVG
jgi:rRNA maturation endonuclease Nob1